MSKLPEMETHHGHEFQVFELTRPCEGCGGEKGQWNANLYKPGWREPVGYCFNPQKNEDAMRGYMKGFIEGMAQG